MAMTDEQIDKLARGAPEDAAVILADTSTTSNVVDIKPTPAPPPEEPKSTIEKAVDDPKARQEERNKRFLSLRKEAMKIPFTPSELSAFAKASFKESLADSILDVEIQLRSCAAQGSQRVTFQTTAKDEKHDWNHKALVEHFIGLGFNVIEQEDSFVVDFS